MMNFPETDKMIHSYNKNVRKKTHLKIDPRLGDEVGLAPPLPAEIPELSFEDDDERQR